MSQFIFPTLVVRWSFLTNMFTLDAVVYWAHYRLPSSRTFLNSEQLYAWELLHPRAKMSRHRGAELRRRFGLLGETSLLSPE